MKNFGMPPSTSTGLYAQPSSSTHHRRSRGTPPSDKAAGPNRVVDRVEGKAKDGVIDMLGDKCARLQAQVDKLRDAKEQMASELAQMRDQHRAEVEDLRQGKEDAEDCATEQKGMLQALEAERDFLRSDAEEMRPTLARAEAEISRLKEKLASERHRRELAEMALDRERRNYEQEQQERSNSHKDQLREQARIDALGHQLSQVEADLRDKDQQLEDALGDVECEREWRQNAQAEQQKSEGKLGALQEQYQQLLDDMDKMQDLYESAEQRAVQLEQANSSLAQDQKGKEEEVDQLKRRFRNQQAKAKMEVSKEKDNRIKELERQLQTVRGEHDKFRVQAEEKERRLRARCDALRKQGGGGSATARSALSTTTTTHTRGSPLTHGASSAADGGTAQSRERRKAPPPPRRPGTGSSQALSELSSVGPGGGRNESEWGSPEGGGGGPRSEASSKSKHKVQYHDLKDDKGDPSQAFDSDAPDWMRF